MNSKDGPSGRSGKKGELTSWEEKVQRNIEFAGQGGH